MLGAVPVPAATATTRTVPTVGAAPGTRQPFVPDASRGFVGATLDCDAASIVARQAPDLKHLDDAAYSSDDDDDVPCCLP